MWRDTARPARLGPVDGRAVLAILVWMFHMRMWTFYLALGVIVVLWLVERKGFSVMVALRAIGSRLAGRVRPAISQHRWRWRMYR